MEASVAKAEVAGPCTGLAAHSRTTTTPLHAVGFSGLAGRLALAITTQLYPQRLADRPTKRRSAAEILGESYYLRV